MALNLNNLIMTDVWNIAGLDITTGKPLFYLVNCNNTEFASTSSTVEITGGKGARVLASIVSEIKASLTVESATFDLNLLSLQAGDKDGIYKTSAIVPYSEKILIDDTGKATLKSTPSALDFVSVMLDNGQPLVEAEGEVPAASATEFTIADKVLTFDAAYQNMTGTAFYRTTVADAVDITVDSGSQIEYATIIAEATFQDSCKGLNYLGRIEIPKAGIDKNFTMSANKAPSDGGSVQNVIFNASASCQDTVLARIFIYDAESLV